jgi:hypothetical protein
MNFYDTQKYGERFLGKKNYQKAYFNRHNPSLTSYKVLMVIDPSSQLMSNAASPKIVELFKSRVLIAQEAPQIDPYLMLSLIFEKGLVLSSIRLLHQGLLNDRDVNVIKAHFNICKK